jgi:hypothetical protein
MLAGVARVTWDDGSHDDNTGWYAVEDLPHLRLEPPNQTDLPAPPNERWRIADGGTIGTLYISTVEDGTLAVGSTLNARPINGSWDRFPSELSFVSSAADSGVWP